jgi:hypothetical protein
VALKSYLVKTTEPGKQRVGNPLKKDDDFHGEYASMNAHFSNFQGLFLSKSDKAKRNDPFLDFLRMKKVLSPLISKVQVLVAPDKDYILIVLQKTKKLGSEDQRE